MAGRAHQASAVPSSVRCPLSQDSDSDDVDSGELWNHRRLQQQVGYLNLNGGYSGGLSPQPSSSAECERHVSPQDPNLSSAARYSPPPPYSSPMAGIEASLEHPDSPMEDLSHTSSLPSLPTSVSSSITSATESLVVSESHRLPPSSVGCSGSRGSNLVSANSLFSSQPVLPHSQPRWPSPDVISDDDDDDDDTVSPTLSESVWAKQKRLAMSNIVGSQPGPSGLQGVSRASTSSFQGIPQPGSSGLHTVLQPCSSGIQTISQPGTSGLAALPQPSPSHRILPRHQRSKSSDSDAEGSNDSRESLPQLSSSPGPSSIRSRLGRLSDGEAEALTGIASGCEASSSVRGHITPLGSPSTPADNCIVSSSTGHIDSIPPTPAEFQGNDVSGPSSPVSPSLASVAILDSTVDSTSGRGIMDSVDQSSDDESEEDNLAPTGQMQLPVMDDEGDEISTSEVGLQHSDDSQDVALLVSPQGMFTSGRASANRFIEQLSLSLSHFSGNSLDASLSGVESGQRSPPNTPPPPPDPGPYLDDPLAIPGSSRASLPCTSKTTSRHVSTPADPSKGQPSTSSSHSITDPVSVLGSSLPLLDIASGLPGCSTASDTDHLSDGGGSGELESASVRLEGDSGGLESASGELEPLVSLANSATNAIVADNVAGNSGTQDFDQLSQSYVLELNDESSVGSEDGLSSGSHGKDDISDRGHNQRSFNDLAASHQSLLDPRELSGGSLNNSLSLNTASSEQNRAIETGVAMPGSSQQTSLAQHLLPSQPDQVSLLVGDGDDSSDGALLMMVSSNSNSIHNSLSLEEQLKQREDNSLDSHLRTSASQNVQPDTVAVTSPSLAVEESDKGNHNEVNSTATTQEVEAEFIGADFWCGECEQTYAHQCPQHRIQEETDKPVRTRAWASLPGQQLIIPKIPERDGCGECGQPNHDCQQHHIQAISDKPVQTRAWASLPAQHLVIRKVTDTEEFGVFARKPIPKRTQFGPFEGIMKVEAIESIAPFGLIYTIISGEEILHLDISDEGSSNWMRFVRKATTYLEQNCVVMQIDGALFFLTTTDIASRTELRVGYSKQYADKRNLQTLEPTGEEIKILDSLRKSWSCYECDEGFESSAEFQQHLVCHDEKVGEEERKKRKRIKTRRSRGNGENGTGIKRLIKRVKPCGEGTSIAGTSQAGSEGGANVLPEGSLQHRQCMICNLVFTMPEVLRIHQHAHERADVKQEDACAITLKEEDKTCPQCIKVFESDVELSTHVEEHGFYLPIPTKRYKCDFCYKSFSRRDRLEAHTTVHGNEAEKPFRCTWCLRQFCSNSALNTHIKFHTEGYDCPICRQGFFSVAALKTHVSTHCVNGEYKCPTCNKVFPTYSKIRRHIRSYHAVITHVCSTCSKEMPSADKLKIHMLSHSDRRDFLCPDCGKRFKRKDKLREHSKRMHSTEREARTSKSVVKAPPKFVPKVDPTDYKQFVYKCHTCLLGFKRRGMLVNHLAKRHPSVDLTSVPELNQPILKATRCYYCQYCDKRYRSSSKRKLHILKYHPGAELPPPSTTHNESESGEGPSFSQTVGATTTYPHPCKWCYRQYASRARLLRHQRHQHKDLCADSSSLKDFAADVPESAVSDVDPLVEAPAGLSGELALGSQLVTDGNLLRNHRLVSLARGEPSTSGAEGTEDDLLTQAMGEITPLASGDQYVRLVGTGAEGQSVVVGTTQTARPLLVSSDGGQQGATLALVTTDSPDTVTLSLPAGQIISLIPGLSVAGTASAVTSTSRSVTSGGGSVNIHTVDTQEGVGSSGELQGEGVSTMRMASSLGSALNDNEAEAAEQVVLATHQPPSPSNSLVWQQTLAFTSAPT